MGSLYATSGAKYATLLNRVGLGRDALSRTLRTLMQQGWILKNPGYGHPLRPEYIVSPQGKKVAPCCSDIVSQAERLGIADIVFNKWSIPVLLSMGKGHERFNHIKSHLRHITPAALTSTLKSLVNAQLVERAISDASPPRVSYRVAPSLGELLTTISALNDRL